MSEFTEVRKIVNKAIKLKKKKEYEKALKILLDALEDYPDNNYLKTSLADTYHRMKRLDKAEDLADEVLLEDAENYNALIVKGNVILSRRNCEEALKFFKQAYQVIKTDYAASRLIRTHIYLENYEEALSICQERLEGDSNELRFKKLEAEIYKKMDKTDKAVEIMEDYLSETDDEFAFKEKIELKLKNKSTEAAVRELKQLLKVDKFRKNIHLQTLLAEKLQELKEYKQAVEVYKEALLSDPGNSFIVKNLGMTLYKDKKYEKALPYLEQAFKDDPNDYYVRTTLEYIYKTLDKYQEGIEFFKGIIKETGMNNLWGIIKKLAKGVEDDGQDS